MVRGFFRSLSAVIRRPGLFVPLYLGFAFLAPLLHALYYVVRSPWTPATAAAILALLVAQQVVMLVRAFIKLAFWGAELAAYRLLDEPEWCRPKVVKERTDAPVSQPLPDPRPEPAQ